jgi:hypothetical protein
MGSNTLALFLYSGCGNVSFLLYITKFSKKIMSRSKVRGAFLKLLRLPNLFSTHKSLPKRAIGGKFVSIEINVLKKSGWLVYPKGGFCRMENVLFIFKKLLFDKKK